MTNLSNTKRLVIKIGSTLLVDQSTGEIRVQWLTSLLDDIHELWQGGCDVVVVSSGAIAVGRQQLQVCRTLQEQQAAAAIGQVYLMQTYQQAFSVRGIVMAQILLTLEDTEARRRYLNARNTLSVLLQQRVIPVINENDTTTTTEIRYGDNDRLAARVAQMIAADTLILLSDVDGLFTSNPQLDANARLIPQVTEITPAIRQIAGDSTSQYGSGGMVTKIKAADIVMSSGCNMLIMSGHEQHPLTRLRQEELGTWFLAQTTPQKARKNWIGHHLKIAGEVIIDAGAAAALQQGKSLLAVGVVTANGNFQKGDAIRICTIEHAEIARGLVNYSVNDVQKILGKNSDQIEELLGYRDSVVHRDNLVLN